MNIKKVAKELRDVHKSPELVDSWWKNALKSYRIRVYNYVRDSYYCYLIQIKKATKIRKSLYLSFFCYLKLISTIYKKEVFTFMFCYLDL